MPIPPLESLCTEIDIETGFPVSLGVTFDPFELAITFPGGVKLQSVMGDPRQAAFDLMGQVNTALMPLQPFFDIIDALMFAKKIFEAVASNPFSIASALPDFLKIIDKLLGYIPAVSVPKLIGSFIDAVIAVAVSLKCELQAIANVQLKIDAAQAQAESLGGSVQASMNVVLACGRAQLGAQLNVLQKKMAPLNRLLGILNMLGSVVGLPELVSFDLTGNPSDCLEALDAVIEALTTVRKAIPV